jgi:hypothetical protein
VITGNFAQYGGGIYLRGQMAEIRSTTISGNRATNRGGGVRLMDGATLVLNRSILWGDCAGSGNEIHTDAGSSVEIFCCALDPAGITGDGSVEFSGEQIHEDPLFCEPMPCDAAPTDVGDYSVAGASPCLPGNSPCGQLVGALGVGCHPVATEAISWGRIKAGFR